MKILNLYVGIGGNRKGWSDEHEVTAVELDPEIAAIYKEFFPKDTVIVGDAHQYLLDHFQEFGFIWSSPPCPTHSRIRFMSSRIGTVKPVYPSMVLYEEILFLSHNYRGLWVVENVISYYDPLIQPKILGRHYIWSNFYIDSRKFDNLHIKDINSKTINFGFDISKFKLSHRKDQIIRNCVNPKLSEFVFNAAFNDRQLVLE